MRRRRRASALALGVEPDREGVSIAIVRSEPLTVVGLGRSHRKPPPGVTDPWARPDLVAEALRSVASAIHWKEPPLVVASAPPAIAGEAGELVSAPIMDHTEIGTATASAVAVERVALALRWGDFDTGRVDLGPLATFRFLIAAAAIPATGPAIVRGSTAGKRWTVRRSDQRVDVAAERSTARSVIVRSGGDRCPTDGIGWGTILLDPLVRRAHPEPGHFTTAVGAALGALGVAPSADLTGLLARRWRPTGAAGQRRTRNGQQPVLAQ